LRGVETLLKLKTKIATAQLSRFIVRYHKIIFMFALAPLCAQEVFAADMWEIATSIIRDVYVKIVGISTVLAGMMSVVAVIGAKLSSNQQKVDRSFDWLKRIWIAWAIINGLGAFVVWFKPFFGNVPDLDGAIPAPEG
jgi:hypothetical protein